MIWSKNNNLIIFIGFLLISITAACAMLTSPVVETPADELVGYPPTPITKTTEIAQIETTPTEIDIGDSRGDIWLEITEPLDGTSLDISVPVHIEGRGQGLFEGNVIVRIENQEGETLVVDATILDSPDMGQEGTWEIGLPVDFEDEAAVTIVAYHESAQDGSIVAEARVTVMLRASSGNSLEQSVAWIEIDSPMEGAVFDTTGPIHIEGRGAGLFENNVAIMIENQSGETLVQSATTLDVMEMGQEGPWQIDLVVDVEVETRARIIAYHASARDGSIVAEDEVTVTLTPAVANGSLEGIPWLLTAFSEGNTASTLFPYTVSMNFDSQQGTVSGDTACYQYIASYDSNDDQLRIGETTRTLVHCDGEPMMDLEDQFLIQLEMVAGYRVHDGLLFLTGQDGKVLMCFQVDTVAVSSYTRQELGNGVYEDLHPYGGAVGLANGVFEEGTLETTDRVWMILTNHMAFADLDGDGTEEAILVTATNTGGTGTFFDLIAVSSTGDNTMQLEARTFLGDRIRINRLRLVNVNQVELDMVVQDVDDPFCCPTLHVIVRFGLQDGEWVLVDERVVGE